MYSPEMETYSLLRRRLGPAALAFLGGDSVRCGSRSQNNFNTPAGAGLGTLGAITSPTADGSLM